MIILFQVKKNTCVYSNRTVSCILAKTFLFIECVVHTFNHSTWCNKTKHKYNEEETIYYNHLNRNVSNLIREGSAKAVISWEALKTNANTAEPTLPFVSRRIWRKAAFLFVMSILLSFQCVPLWVCPPNRNKSVWRHITQRTL